MIFKIIRSNYNGDWRELLIELLAFLVAIYFGIVVHEVAHGLVALWNGDRTAQIDGRLTMDPIRHIDPVGAVMMLVVGIGWAKPVPINPHNFRHLKRGMITVSLAGIIANLINTLVSIAMIAAVLALAKATVEAEDAWFYICKLLLYIFEYSAIINVSLAGFNLLPFFPLDGFRLIETLTPPNNGYVRFMRRYGIYVYFVLIGLSILSDVTGWPCDVLGLYIGEIQTGVIKLINLILGAV